MHAEAARLGIDPNHIGTWGSSAGGQLVAMLGTAGAGCRLDVGQYLDHSSRVQAVVDMFGPTDLTGMGDSNSFGRPVVQIAFGGTSDAEKTAELRCAPGIHRSSFGTARDDALVRPHHSSDLARA